VKILSLKRHVEETSKRQKEPKRRGEDGRNNDDNRKGC
jgi:hypothetical protein